MLVNLNGPEMSLNIHFFTCNATVSFFVGFFVHLIEMVLKCLNFSWVQFAAMKSLVMIECREKHMLFTCRMSLVLGGPLREELPCLCLPSS